MYINTYIYIYVSESDGTYQPPPQSVGVGVEVLRWRLAGGVVVAGHVHGDVVLLHQVDQERRQDQRQEADVPSGDQLLGTTDMDYPHTGVRGRVGR